MGSFFVRTVVAVVGLSVTGLMAGASAATAPSKLVFTDAVGDALAGQTSYDITRVSLTTKGITTKVGKKVTYRPKSLIVSMTIAGEFATTSGAAYGVDVQVAGCGYANFSYTPNGGLSEGGLFTECGSPEDETGSTATLYQQAPVVNGKTVTWEFALSGLSQEFKAGTAISAITAHAVQNDPVFGLIGTGIVSSQGNFDNAVTDKSFTI